MSTFGETGAGTTTTAADFADKAAVTTVTITELALVSKLTMRLSNQGAGHVACQGYAVIYTDNSAVPHALYATGSAVDISDNVAMGEIDFAFAKAVLMEPGTYHIGVIFDDDADGVALRYLAGGREDTHADVPPPLELWGTTSATANTYCCYATYTAITYTRPLAADTEILVTTKARVPVGRVPARVRWTQVLDGPDRLDSVTMPKWFLKQNGVRVSRPELAKYGWCIKHSGHWYTLDRVTSDNETSVTFAGRSIEVSELARNFASTGVGGFVRTAEVPQVVMDELFGRYGDIKLKNTDLADTTYRTVPVASTYVDDWLTGSIWLGTYPVDFLGPGDLYYKYGAGISGRSTPSLAGVADPVKGKVLQWAHQLQTQAGKYGEEWFYPGSYDDWFAMYANRSYYHRGVPTKLGTDVGSTVTVSADFRYAPALAAPDLPNWIANGGSMNLMLVWWASDGETITGIDKYDVAPSLTTSWQTLTFSATAKTESFTPVLLYATGPGAAATFSNDRVYFTNLVASGTNTADPFEWSYFGCPVSVRDTDILHTDAHWIEFGTWTVGATDRSSTTVGNKLVYVITGTSCTVHFAAGGAGALCDIYLDDEVLAQNVDVAAATTYAITDLDKDVEHLLSLRIVAVKLAVEKLVVDPEQRITVFWSDMDYAACLNDLVNAVSGEVFVDTENKRLYHLDAVGQDLLAENILDLRRGTNLLSCDITAQRTEIANHLLYLGYGTGATRLRLTVIGQGVNSDGDTSEEAYDVQWGKYENPDCQDFYLGQLEAQEVVNEWQWPATEYRLTCPDETAAYICAGDTVRIYWDADPDDIINVSVRVLEVTRDNEGGIASLVVGTRVSQLPDRLAATARKIDRVSRNL